MGVKNISFECLVFTCLNKPKCIIHGYKIKLILLLINTIEKLVFKKTTHHCIKYIFACLDHVEETYLV